MADIEFNRFKQLLKKHGYYVSKPRQRLFGHLQTHPALTTRELIGLVKKHDRATVYRNIELFEKLGIINRIRLGWHTKIELSDVFKHHHHHLTCLKCGRVIALAENKILESQITGISKKRGFKMLDHQLEIRGLCANCQKKY